MRGRRREHNEGARGIGTVRAWAASPDGRAVIGRPVILIGAFFGIGVLVGGLRYASELALLLLGAYVVVMTVQLLANRRAGREFSQALSSDSPNCLIVGGPLDGTQINLPSAWLRAGGFRVPLLVDGRTRSHGYRIEQADDTRTIARLEYVNRVSWLF